MDARNFISQGKEIKIFSCDQHEEMKLRSIDTLKEAIATKENLTDLCVDISGKMADKFGDNWSVTAGKVDSYRFTGKFVRGTCIDLLIDKLRVSIVCQR